MHFIWVIIIGFVAGIIAAIWHLAQTIRPDSS
jgi:uncharacterized membrane protein YeaQ/YmgE (transglycosylase-associated protein family)